MHLNFELKKKFNIFIIPETLDYQSLLSLRTLENTSGINLKFFGLNTVSFKTKNMYLNNNYSSISRFEKNSKVCYLLSSNLKLENIILNIKIRAKIFKTQMSLFSAGFSYSAYFPNRFISLNLKILFKFFESKNLFSLNFIRESNS